MAIICYNPFLYGKKNLDYFDGVSGRGHGCHREICCDWQVYIYNDDARLRRQATLVTRSQSYRDGSG